MVELLKYLFLGHSHKWKTIEKQSVTIANAPDKWIRYICQCEKCGVIKAFNPRH